jgi:hypothetical protein
VGTSKEREISVQIAKEMLKAGGVSANMMPSLKVLQSFSRFSVSVYIDSKCRLLITKVLLPEENK